MNNSLIFASPRLNYTMGSYCISLDDELVAKVEGMLSGEESFQSWLQKQVDTLLQAKANESPYTQRTHGGGPSDEELAEKLKGLPPLCSDDFPDIDSEDYEVFFKERSGRLPKGAERWL